MRLADRFIDEFRALGFYPPYRFEIVQDQYWAVVKQADSAGPPGPVLRIANCYREITMREDRDRVQYLAMETELGVTGSALSRKW